MDDKFPLLKQLTEMEQNLSTVTPLPKGIKYKEFTLSVGKDEIEVFIPVRETDAFEQTLSECSEHLKHEDVSELLRKHRGIRNRK